MAELFSRWRDGLAMSSKGAFGRLAGLLGATEIKPDTWEALEALLVQADVGIETADDVIFSLKRIVNERGVTRADELRDVLRAELRSRLLTAPPMQFSTRPTVIVMVGVNGSGKTTTMAKLGQRYRSEGKSVIFGAADTFRAAASDQLEVWGQRLKIDVVSGAPESDPGAVAYNAVQSGVARKTDV